MAVKYIGTNEEFAAAVAGTLFENKPAPEAVKTGKFRNADRYNRNRFPLTAALLDVHAAPYSTRLRKFHKRVMLRMLQALATLSLDHEDMEIV